MFILMALLSFLLPEAHVQYGNLTWDSQQGLYHDEKSEPEVSLLILGGVPMA